MLNIEVENELQTFSFYYRENFLLILELFQFDESRYCPEFTCTEYSNWCLLLPDSNLFLKFQNHFTAEF